LQSNRSGAAREDHLDAGFTLADEATPERSKNMLTNGALNFPENYNGMNVDVERTKGHSDMNESGSQLLGSHENNASKKSKKNKENMDGVIAALKAPFEILPSKKKDRKKVAAVDYAQYRPDEYFYGLNNEPYEEFGNDSFDAEVDERAQKYAAIRSLNEGKRKEIKKKAFKKSLKSTVPYGIKATLELRFDYFVKAVQEDNIERALTIAKDLDKTDSTLTLACLYLCLRNLNKGLFRDLLDDPVIKETANRVGMGVNKPDNNTQFFLYTTLTDNNFAGYNWELATMLGRPKYATVTNQTLYELIQHTLKDSRGKFNLRPIVPYVTEATHICTVATDGAKRIKPINLVDIFRMLFLMRNSVNQEEFLYLMFDFVQYISERDMFSHYETKLFFRELMQLKSAGLVTSHQVTSILSCINGNKIVPQASQMFAWVLTEHHDYKVGIFLYMRYIQIVKNAKFRIEGSVLKMATHHLVYSIHKILHI
jgi:hypothetical protein